MHWHGVTSGRQNRQRDVGPAEQSLALPSGNSLSAAIAALTGPLIREADACAEIGSQRVESNMGDTWMPETDNLASLRSNTGLW